MTESARRFLILDDDIMAGETICKIGEFAGLESVHTASPAEFFDLVEKWMPDIIALDLLMPEMDGVEVMARLSQLECNANLIITSGVEAEVLNSADLSASGHGLNSLGVLPKPFSPATLRSLLARPLLNETKNSIFNQGNRIQEPTKKDLDNAIKAREISVVYQPKIYCKTGTLAGFEALARWSFHGKPVPPDQFIPMAEENGLIDGLTRLIVEQALQWLALASDEQNHNTTVAISQAHLSLNISAKTLTNQSLFRWIVSLCDELGIQRQRLIFELTESSAMSDVVTALDTLTRLRMQGFKLSIDDFGTGFSSMVQLVRLPFSEIKIDKSFVIGTSDSSESKAVTRSIVDLGRSLGLLSTAEGVEDQDTLDYLQALGCDLAQGYFISKPMGGMDISAWHQKREEAREAFRLESIKNAALLCSQPEQRFDRLTYLARRLFDVPISLVTLIDQETQWIKSGYIDSNKRMTRKESFCTHTIALDDVLIVQDTSVDKRFNELELVKGKEEIRFYAGYPVCLPNGSKAGALCLLDRVPREVSDKDIKLLKHLAMMVETELAASTHSDDGFPQSILNKKALCERIHPSLEIAKAVDEPVIAILLTLDQLGDINRKFGRAMGDRYLKEVAIAIDRIIGPSDLVGRYRGGEFLIIQMNITITDAQSLFITFKKALEDLSVTLSIPVHALLSIVALDTGKTNILEDDIEEARATATGIGTSLKGEY